jgi:O-antigen/teichoic acid export membrane protein
MGVVIRQSFKATLVSYAGACIGALLVILIYPKCLTPEQIGLTRILLEAATFFALFSQLGISNVVIKFFPHFKDSSHNHHGFFFLVLIVPLVGFSLFTLVYLLFREPIILKFSNNSRLVVNYFIFVIPLTLFVMYTTIFESYSSMLLRIVIPKLFREILVRILTIVIIILFFFKFINLNEFVFCFVAIYGLTMIMNLVYLNKLEPISWKPEFKFFDKNLLKAMGTFVLYMIVVGSGSGIAGKIDIYMISTRISLADTGIFTIAFFIAAFIEMPSRAMFQITTPFISEALKNNSIDKVTDLYKRVALNQLIVSGLLFLLIWANANNIFSIMPNGHIYEKGKYVIFFIGLAKVFDAATGLNASILGYSKYYFYTLFFIFFLAGLAIVNNIIFIPLYGITGAAMATAISIFLYNIILVIFVKIKLKTQPFSLKTLFAALILVSFFILNSLFHPLHNVYIDAIIRSAILSGLFVIIVLKLKISEDFNNTFNALTKKYIGKYFHF